MTSKYSVIDALEQKYAADAAAAAQQPQPEEEDSMGQRLAQLEFQQQLMATPMNGTFRFDNTNPQMLQQVMQQRPDLLWPGTNPNGTIQMNFTGDRYDR